MTDYDVTVCAACLTASCWHGEFMCDKARSADVTTLKASELRRLGREHPDNFSPEKLFAVTGREPEGCSDDE
jgi:hypothetical protein